ncbi:synaptic vesicle glycoprotein 2B-like [Glossina fuscipes]|uniref:Synaptic vesicle glycoprotein 2B-like n=1 Tax=Glossina fuscipes TaxID=7396 RepID=A0A9C6DWP2_9MUSC|nr:synaptic vesicle glycoprotein 2B-like [Glossina fuscipes]
MSSKLLQKLRLSSASEEEATDFETAIALAGFGTFNVLLVSLSSLSVFATLFSSTSMSFILPTAECDLHLDLNEKGLLNGITFAGMITSTIPWGFAADTIGRKKVLIAGLLSNAVFVVCCGFSQNVKQLLAFTFFDGLAICGPYAVTLTYLSEFHGLKHRRRIIMVFGILTCTSTILLPTIAYAVLPHRLVLKTDYISLNSWNIFLLITAVVPLLGGILHIFFPPSPKYLMSQGRNNEALKAIATAYAINKRSTKDAYPIKVLVDEAPERAERNTLRKNPEYKQNLKTLSGKRKEAITRFRENLGQLKPLLSKPYLSLALRVCFTMFFIFMSFHSVRLWMPQLFVTVDQYEQEHEIMKDICDVLNVMRDKTQPEESSNCDEVVSVIDNNFLASSLYLAAMSVSSNNLFTIEIELFPTFMRAIVILVSLGFGRLGALLGLIKESFTPQRRYVPAYTVSVAVILIYSATQANNY